MCEGMLGGMCAGVVCEVILFCTRSVLRSSNCMLDGWRHGVSGKERASIEIEIEILYNSFFLD